MAALAWRERTLEEAVGQRGCGRQLHHNHEGGRAVADVRIPRQARQHVGQQQSDQVLGHLQAHAAAACPQAADRCWANTGRRVQAVSEG